jgi:ferredoxin-NADP reductase
VPASIARAPAGLTNRLLRSRLLDALAYPHGVDRYVELVRPLLVGREVRAEVTAARRQTDKSVTLSMRANENWRGLRAGQFVGLSVDVEGVRETRPYSPAGPERAAQAGELELTVSTHPEGRLSRYLRDHARPGLIVGLTEAQGEFVLPPARPRRILLISGGSGITPVMAMLRTLCEEGHTRGGGEIGFLNYARSPELALYGPALADLAGRHAGLRVARGYTREYAHGPAGTHELAGVHGPAGVHGRAGEARGLAGDTREYARGVADPHGRPKLSGRFCREHLRAVISEHADAATFVCGPPALIESVRATWAQDGLPEPAVETFTALAPRHEAAGQLGLDVAGAEGTVSFTASGVALANSGLPLLEQAEDAGLAPEHGCRMGICNTCSCRKRTGTVRNIVTGAASSAGEEQIRICVSVPVGDVELDL